MKKYFTFLFFISLALQLFEVKADYWTQLSDFPGPVRQVSSSFTIGSRGYVCCGYNGSSLADLWEYNSVTNQWTQKAELPGAGRNGAASFAIGNKGYVGMGAGEQTDFWEYDPVANSWTRRADFPGAARGFAASFAIGTKGYFGLGGNNGTLGDFWEWDQVTDAWQQKNNFPGPGRGYLTCFVVNGKGYMNGGLSGNTYFHDNWEYDPVNDAWTQMADLPADGRADASSFTICDKGYLGSGGEEPFYHDFWQFDPSLNLWIRKADVPGGGRDDCAYFSIGNKGYLGLGQLMGVTYATDFWEYTPDSECVLPPVASFGALNGLCPGTCAIVYNFSLNATSWQWSFPGATVTSSSSAEPTAVCYNTPGTYDITLVASNAAGSDTMVLYGCITVYPFTLPQAIVQNGDSLISAQGFANYQWYYDGDLVPGATEYFYVISDSGDYNVICTDTNGCEVEAAIYDVHIGIEELNAENEIVIFPDPVGEKLFIRFDKLQGSSIAVYNTLGEVIHLPVDTWDQTIDCKLLSPGIYFLVLSSGSKTIRSKFLKE